MSKGCTVILRNARALEVPWNHSQVRGAGIPRDVSRGLNVFECLWLTGKGITPTFLFFSDGILFPKNPQNHREGSGLLGSSAVVITPINVPFIGEISPMDPITIDPNKPNSKTLLDLIISPFFVRCLKTPPRGRRPKPTSSPATPWRPFEDLPKHLLLRAVHDRWEAQDLVASVGNSTRIPTAILRTFVAF